jgi:Uma2 family endonuclease
MATRIGPILTVADLEVMPNDGNRYELIEGELLGSHASILTHQRISGNIFLAISRYIDEHPIGEVVATPGVIFDDFSSVIPDIIFMSNERRAEIASGERLTGAPELVIEILSPGAENIRRDRDTKRQVYGKYGVREYWIVDPESHAVDLYRLQAGVLEPIATFTNQDAITASVLPGFGYPAGDAFRI